MIDLKLLSNFLVLCEDTSLTRAATRLYITQSTLSRQMAELEREMGVRLFEREKNAAHLTPAGKSLAERGGELLRHMLSLEAELQEISAGNTRRRLRVSTFSFTTAAFREIMRDYHALLPEVEINLQPSEPDGVAELLLSGRCDIGFTTSLALENLDERERKGLTELTVMRGGIIAAVLPGHPLAGRSSIAVRELRDYRLVMPHYPGSETRLLAFLESCGIDRSGLELCDTRGVVRAIREDGKTALVFGGDLPDLGPGIIAVPLEEGSFTAGLVYIVRSDDNRTEIMDYLRMVRSYHGAEQS